MVIKIGTKIIENNSDVLEYHDITIAEINIDNFDRYFAFNNIWKK